VDKNSDKLYDEVIDFDKAVYDKYSKRMEQIIDAAEPPPRISNNPTWYECKWCEHHPVCHMKAEPLRNCRTCAHSTPVNDGEWLCERPGVGEIIPKKIIKIGCTDYHRHPME